MRSIRIVLVSALLSLGCGKLLNEAAASSPTKITADDKGFTPSSVTAKKGESLVLEFTRTSDRTCAREVFFPQLNLKRDLPLNTPVTVTISTTEAKTLTFACGMDMMKGTVVVE